MPPPGILFGVSDVAIKAISGMVGAHGFAGLLSPWLFICLAASVVAFYASAKAFQDGDAVPVIAVTGTAANVAGIVGGFIVFGDPLPTSPVPVVLQCLAFMLVVGAAWLMPAPVRATAAAPASSGSRFARRPGAGSARHPCRAAVIATPGRAWTPGRPASRHGPARHPCLATGRLPRRRPEDAAAGGPSSNS